DKRLPDYHGACAQVVPFLNGVYDLANIRSVPGVTRSKIPQRIAGRYDHRRLRCVRRNKRRYRSHRVRNGEAAEDHEGDERDDCQFQVSEPRGGMRAVARSGMPTLRSPALLMDRYVILTTCHVLHLQHPKRL